MISISFSKHLFIEKKQPVERVRTEFQVRGFFISLLFILLIDFIIMADKKYHKIQSMNTTNAHFILIPIALVRAKGWEKGTKIRFEINDKGRLEIFEKSTD